MLVLAVLGWTGIDPRMTPFNAVALSFGTVATGGFSTEPRSIEPFAPATQWAIVVFMLVAGTNFAVLYASVVDAERRGLLLRDEELRVGLRPRDRRRPPSSSSSSSRADVLAGEEAVRHGVFNTVSMMTTTGFASADFNAVDRR